MLILQRVMSNKNLAYSAEIPIEIPEHRVIVGDCRMVWPDEVCDLVVTDPLYGVDYHRNRLEDVPMARGGGVVCQVEPLKAPPQNRRVL